MTDSPWPSPAVAGALAAWAGAVLWAGAGVARAPSVGPLHRMAGAVVALLALPGALVALALGAAETAQAVQQGVWVWPLVAVLAVPQPLAAWRAGRAPAWLAVPLVGWNLAALLDAAARVADAGGVALPTAVMPVIGAPRGAWVDLVGPSALDAAWTLVPPLLCPVWPPRLRLGAAGRVGLALVAWVGTGATFLGGLRLWPVVASYTPLAEEPLRERPGGDFVVGASAFGVVVGLPPSAHARGDDAVLDLLETSAVHVRVSSLARPAALDSLARLLDARRRVGSAVLVTIEALDAPGDSARLAGVVRRLGRATYVVATPDDSSPPARWQRTVARRAAAVAAEQGAERRADGQGVRPRVAVALTIAQGDRHAWAASAASPVDEIVLVTTPAPAGASPLSAQWARWSQWIAEAEAPRAYWMLGTGGVPAAHGALSHRYAMRGALAWATAEPRVRGAIVGDAADHGRLRGLRTATGAWRPAAATVLRTVRALRDTRAPDVSPPAGASAPPP